MTEREREPDLFDQQPYGGHAPSQTHSDTSTSAADEIEQHVGRLQAIVLDEFGYGDGTDEEMMIRTGLVPNTYRPRRRELQLKGLVRDSGVRRQTNSGRLAVVWTATPR